MLMVHRRLKEALQSHLVSAKPMGTVGSILSGLYGKERQIA